MEKTQNVSSEIASPPSVSSPHGLSCHIARRDQAVAALLTAPKWLNARNLSTFAERLWIFRALHACY